MGAFVTLILHLGVVDVPYTADPSNADTPKQRRGKKRNDVRAAFGASEFKGTTGDVAEILEDHYHVMELFYEEIGAEAIAKALALSMSNGVADIAMGAPATLDIAQDATQEIEEAFRIFIDQRELDGVVPGVPTLASLRGVNHRFKHPYAKDNPARPSFKDTGLYQASFKVWTEE